MSLKNTLSMVTAMDKNVNSHVKYLTTETYFHAYELCGILYSIDRSSYNDAVDYLHQLIEETSPLYMRDILVNCAAFLKRALYSANELESMNIIYKHVKALQKDHENVLCSIRTSTNVKQCTRFFNQLWCVEKALYCLDCVKWQPYSQRDSDMIRASVLGNVKTVYSALYLYLNGNQQRRWSIETGDTLTKISNLMYEAGKNQEGFNILGRDFYLENWMKKLDESKGHDVLGMYNVDVVAKVFLDILTEKYAPNHDLQRTARKCLDLLLDMPVM